MNKRGQRADTYKRGFYSDADILNEDVNTNVGSYEHDPNHGFTTNLDKKKFVTVARPFCHECHDRNVYIDENGDAVCRNCGAMKGSESSTLVYDLNAAERYSNNDR